MLETKQKQFIKKEKKTKELTMKYRSKQRKKKQRTTDVPLIFNKIINDAK